MIGYILVVDHDDQVTCTWFQVDKMCEHSVGSGWVDRDGCRHLQWNGLTNLYKAVSTSHNTAPPYTCTMLKYARHTTYSSLCS